MSTRPARSCGGLEDLSRSYAWLRQFCPVWCVGTPTDRQAVVHADDPYVLGHSLLGLQVIEGVTHTLDGTGQRSTRRPLSRTPLKTRNDTTVPYRKGREFARMPFLHGRPADFGSHAFSCICACAPAHFSGAIGLMHRCGACQLALMMRPSAFTDHTHRHRPRARCTGHDSPSQRSWPSSCTRWYAARWHAGSQ